MSDKEVDSFAANKKLKRTLPSWMSSRGNEDELHRKGQTDIKSPEDIDEADDLSKENQGVGGPSGSAKKNAREASTSKLGSTNLSKLLEGVVLVLSGFVNPERGILRSLALEMGAKYQPDWNSDCTLLVCSFRNTPKFRQVEADCGTIVSKEWITECHSKKMLVDIETYLMHAGKPWRRQDNSNDGNQGETSASRKLQKQAERSPKANTSASSKNETPNLAKTSFPSSELKKWAIDDLNKTTSWLESQDEKPNPAEIKKIAAEGILACLQDAIDFLKQRKDIREINEQWMFIPQVVEKLAKLEDDTGSGLPSLSKDDLYKQAMACKKIYEVEFSNLDDSSSLKHKKTESNSRVANVIEKLDADAADDSDKTIEMTEEEIDQAYNTVTSKFHSTKVLVDDDM